MSKKDPFTHKLKYVKNLFCLFAFFLLHLISFGQGDKRSSILKTAIIFFEDSCDYQKSLQYSLEARKNAFAQDNKVEIILSDLYIGKCYTYLDQKEGITLSYLQRARKNCIPFKKKHLCPTIDLAIAILFVENGEHDVASVKLFQLLNVFEKEKDEYNIAQTNVGIAKMYFNSRKVEFANAYNEKAIQLFTKLKKEPELAVSMIRKVGFLQAMGKIDAADKLLRAAFIKFPSLHHGYGKFLYTNKRSMIYLANGDNEKGLEYSFKAWEEVKHLGLIRQKLDMIRRIGFIYESMGDIKNALIIADSLEQNATNYQNPIANYHNSEFFAQIYATAGNYQKAFRHQKQVGILKDKIASENLVQKIRALEAKQVAEKKDQQIRDLNREKELSTYRLYFFIAIIILLLLLTLAAFYRYRSKLKQAKIQASHAKEIIELETAKKIKALEIQILYAQMNPHFVFNCLSAIQHLFLSGDRQNANEKLSNFSRLLRLSIDHVKNDFVELEKELKFLQYYIDLEQLQFDSPFEFKLINNCSTDLDELLIPSMILQPFVENAINHGLKHRKESCVLSITINELGENTEVIIEDNGVGRAKSAKIKSLSQYSHPSRGLSLVQEKISALQELYGDQVIIETTDLFDSASIACGTRVSILFLKKSAT